MSLKKDLEYYFLITEKYEGTIILKLKNKNENAQFYLAETEANIFEVCISNDYEKNRVFFYREDVAGGQWKSNQLGANVIESGGLPALLNNTGVYVKSFSELLRDYRKKNNLTVPEFTRILHVPQITLEKWLSGARVPDNYKLSCILNQLEIL